MFFFLKCLEDGCRSLLKCVDSSSLCKLNQQESALLFSTQVNATSFSYYLVDRDSGVVSTLEFDSSLLHNVVITSLLQNPDLDMFYYLELKGFSAGGEALEVPNASFAVDAASGDNIIMDSGTAVTKLWSQVYEKLKEAFVRGTKGLLKAKGVLLFDTCYDISSMIVWKKKEEGRMKKEKRRKREERKKGKKKEEERKE
ncbi:hypothetical protein Fmac_005992 [Flemingia macrophylla]|uniref:Xylanase inhibitor C-terminal domain-containing protein n=1 Tax=Flemingia macrophylla TaxID=520843 RepID=A0ABD1N9B9_9FABA